ncbi:hypothetical protein [Micromonospora sp. NPDC005299]|uniref:hypothetical protein n=1 Tax=Micromonospora sp. NPDC005299 TaxID=3364231 RepID=UPI0036CCD99C
MVAGEIHQQTGSIGIDRAKRWLDNTTRVSSIYTNTEKVFGDLLHFRWPHGGQSFSFDIGGKLRGGALHDKSFMAEVKAYKYEMDSAREYAEFVAECYVAFQDKPDYCDNLIWLSWAPFQAQSWHKHRTPETIRKHLLHKENIHRVFGTTSVEEAKAKLNEQVVYELTNRLWLLTLCEEQESLVITTDNYNRLRAFMGVDEESR